jgi:hypothetical protein
MFTLLGLIVTGFVFAGLLAVLVIAAIAVKLAFRLILWPFALLAAVFKFVILGAVGLLVAAVVIPVLFAAAVVVVAVVIPIIIIGGLIAVPFFILHLIF